MSLVEYFVKHSFVFGLFSGVGWRQKVLHLLLCVSINDVISGKVKVKVILLKGISWGNVLLLVSSCLYVDTT